MQLLYLCCSSFTLHPSCFELRLRHLFPSSASETWATDWKVGGSNPVEERISAPIQTYPGAHPASYTMGTGSFPGVKRPGTGVDHSPPSSAEVKEKVELYFYSPLWVFVACFRLNLIFTFHFTSEDFCSSIIDLR
jgi:hypothetical protein